MPSFSADGHVFDQALNLPASSIFQPTQLGQEDFFIPLIELDCLQLWKSEAVPISFFLEARKICNFLEKPLVGGFEISKDLLLDVDRCFGQPWRVRVVAPSREYLTEPSVATFEIAWHRTEVQLSIHEWRAE